MGMAEANFRYVMDYVYDILNLYILLTYFLFCIISVNVG